MGLIHPVVPGRLHRGGLVVHIQQVGVDGSRLNAVGNRALAQILVGVLLRTCLVVGHHRQVEVLVLEGGREGELHARAHLELVGLRIGDVVIVVVGIAAVRQAARHESRLRVGIDVEVDAAVEGQAVLAVLRAQELVLDVEVGHDAVGLLLLPRAVGVGHGVADGHDVLQLRRGVVAVVGRHAGHGRVHQEELARVVAEAAPVVYEPVYAPVAPVVYEPAYDLSNIPVVDCVPYPTTCEYCGGLR